MRNNLPEIDMEKLQIVLDTKERYLDGKLTLDEARAILRERVKTLRPYEIALAEQELKTFDEDECRKEDIQQMMELFQDVLDRSRPDLPDDHPIMCYLRENDEMRRLLKQVEELAQYPVIKNQWLELYDELHKFRLHLSRKQNQLYSILERKGFDRPTTTMWLLDDFIRDEIRDARRLLEEDKDDEFIAMQPTVVADVLDLMQKEETVLYPTSLAMIRPAEFEEMKSGDREIGFAWIRVGKEAPKADTPKEAVPATAAAGFANELASLLGKYGFGGGSTPGALLEVATGQMTLEQINLVYKHMPVDFSYVDENEIVRFYTDTDHRVFPRSKNVIGRDVKNCHPRTSVHLVEEIIEKFRRGEQNEVDFWINKPGLFIYIYYVAVRDEEGRFRGVLEMMQDCTHIRSLEGSQTLLTWSAKEHGGESADGDGEQARDSKAEGSAARPDKQAAAPAEGSSSTKESSPEEDEAPVPSAQATSPINGDTRLRDLLAAHPWLKDALPQVNEKFALLNSPLARVMIPKATVRMMAERSGMNLDELSRRISELISAHGE